MYRFMNRQNGGGELEAIVRYQKIDFPAEGPEQATPEQRKAFDQIIADAAKQEARMGQIVLATWASTGGIVVRGSRKTRPRMQMPAVPASCA
jgi:hypothetical protein